MSTRDKDPDKFRKRYSLTGDGTITDNRSGLMWEVLVDDGSIHDWNDTYTWPNAFLKVQSLNTASFAGHSGCNLWGCSELDMISVSTGFTDFR
jgi:hypothetical protein